MTSYVLEPPQVFFHIWEHNPGLLHKLAEQIQAASAAPAQMPEHSPELALVRVFIVSKINDTRALPGKMLDHMLHPMPAYELRVDPVSRVANLRMTPHGRLRRQRCRSQRLSR